MNKASMVLWLLFYETNNVFENEIYAIYAILNINLWAAVGIAAAGV